MQFVLLVAVVKLEGLTSIRLAPSTLIPNVKHVPSVGSLTGQNSRAPVTTTQSARIALSVTRTSMSPMNVQASVIGDVDHVG